MKKIGNFFEYNGSEIPYLVIFQSMDEFNFSSFGDITNLVSKEFLLKNTWFYNHDHTKNIKEYLEDL